jgi:hypothetical protein
MRCKLLYQGRAITNKPGRYEGFSFGQPANTGYVDHMRVEGRTPHCKLHLDVGKLAIEMKVVTEAWISQIEKAPTSQKAANVKKNLQSLVKVTLYSPPLHRSTGIVPQIYKTN